MSKQKGQRQKIKVKRDKVKKVNVKRVKVKKVKVTDLQLDQHGLHLSAQLVHLVLELVDLQRVLLLLRLHLAQDVLVLLLQLRVLRHHTYNVH